MIGNRNLTLFTAWGKENLLQLIGHTKITMGDSYQNLASLARAFPSLPSNFACTCTFVKYGVMFTRLVCWYVYVCCVVEWASVTLVTSHLQYGCMNTSQREVPLELWEVWEVWWVRGVRCERCEVGEMKEVWGVRGERGVRCERWEVWSGRGVRYEVWNGKCEVCEVWNGKCEVWGVWSVRYAGGCAVVVTNTNVQPSWGTKHVVHANCFLQSCD